MILPKRNVSYFPDRKVKLFNPSKVNFLNDIVP
jgi:hypothetical protein